MWLPYLIRVAFMIGYFSDGYVVKDECCGKALELAKLVKTEKDIFSSFYAPIATDIPGLKLIDFLIQNQIFFDPDLLYNQYTSPLFKEEKGEFIASLTDSVYTHLDEEVLTNSISINPDLKLFYISPITFSFPSLCKTIASSIAKGAPKAKVILDFTDTLMDESLITLFSTQLYGLITEEKSNCYQTIAPKEIVETLAQVHQFL